jgi:inhibitor of KinA
MISLSPARSARAQNVTCLENAVGRCGGERAEVDVSSNQAQRIQRMGVRFLPAGDTALVVEFGDRIDRQLNDRVLHLRARLHAAAINGVVETVPTFRSLMVHYDPNCIAGSQLTKTIRNLLDKGTTKRSVRRLWQVPICYGQDCAPDLAEVAERTALTTQEVARCHGAVNYHVYMIGFVPGFPYMGDLPPEIDLPRRREPRAKVPPGSVAIASGMTGIYPIESPGGWHLIGATPILLFDVGSNRPSLFAPGDTVRFHAIGRDEYDMIRAAVGANKFTVPSIEIEE